MNLLVFRLIFCWLMISLIRAENYLIRAKSCVVRAKSGGIRAKAVLLTQIVSIPTFFQVDPNSIPSPALIVASIEAKLKRVAKC